MTATLPPRVRLDARPGFVYGYRILGLDGIGYVGQARDPERRDRQHRGLIPQRDGVVREQPWTDLIVGGMVILERGVWTDAELDAAELRHMHTRLPRLNCRDSITPDRIPIFEQRDQRDARDVENGLAPRDWAKPHGPGVRPVVAVPVRPVAAPSVWSRLARSRVGYAIRARVDTVCRALVTWLAQAALVTAVWVAGTVALWLAAWQLLGVTEPGLNGFAALVAGVAVWKLWPRRRGPSRRRRTRRRR